MRVKNIEKNNILMPENKKFNRLLNLSPLLSQCTHCSKFGDLNTKKIIGIIFDSQRKKNRWNGII